jgi:hypothetical protein
MPLQTKIPYSGSSVGVASSKLAQAYPAMSDAPSKSAGSYLAPVAPSESVETYPMSASVSPVSVKPVAVTSPATIKPVASLSVSYTVAANGTKAYTNMTGTDAGSKTDAAPVTQFTGAGSINRISMGTLVIVFASLLFL